MIDVDNKSTKNIETGRMIKDQLEKSLLSYPDVFAGIAGVLFFDGSYKIASEHLIAIDPVALSLTDRARQTQRDVAMAWMIDGKQKAILLCENQTDIDKNEPIRILDYTADFYKRQVETHQEAVAIIMAIVLNYGNQRWVKHKDLSHLLVDLPDEVRGYFDVQAIKVIDVCFLSDEQLAKIEGDFKGLALYLREVREKRQENVLQMIQGNDVPLNHPKEVLLLLSEITKDDSYFEIYERMRRERSVITTMSDAVEAIMARGESIGMAKGEQIGIAKGEQIGIAKGEQIGLISTLINLLTKKFPGHSFEWLFQLEPADLKIIEEHIFVITYEEVMKFRPT